MGQKANLITLRTSYSNFNLQTSFSKLFLLGFFFLNALKKMSKKKKILLVNHNLNFSGNKIFLHLVLFFNTAKLFYYKKKKKKVWKNKSTIFHTLFSNKLLFHFKKYRINLIIFNIKNLNKHLNTKLDKKVLRFLYKKGKSFIFMLFQRRYTLFFDFLKQIVLLLKGLLNANSFLQTLGFLFRYIHKKLHTKFFLFFNLISKLILTSNLCQERMLLNKIYGLKLLVKGRLKGKMRASATLLQQGTVPNQTLSKKIDYSMQHVLTIYGVYGLTLWIHKE